ncbi:Uncharacterised protein [Mycobacteroides abscessus subsp. abscessus]|nr:Uncharacterised protein [Mycobacteroides abscessus subsp. abscessus]
MDFGGFAPSRFPLARAAARRSRRDADTSAGSSSSSSSECTDVPPSSSGPEYVIGTSASVPTPTARSAAGASLLPDAPLPDAPLPDADAPAIAG